MNKSLSSRLIVALADVFDALTSERPYNAPFPVEKALAIIKEGQGSHFDPQEGQGSHFDPQVVDAFLAIEDEIRAEFNWWKFMASDSTSEESGLPNLFG